MNTGEESWPEAWEPLSPRGVAAFAGASLGRLLVVQGFVAMLAAASVIWFISNAWFPVVRSAIQELPAAGQLRDGELHWAGESSVQLAENRFLGLAIDLDHNGQLGRAAHLQVEFGRKDFRVYSLLGYQAFDYQAGWFAPANEPELEPWWGAWEPYLLTMAGGTTFLALMIAWPVMATVYSVPIYVVSFFQNRDLSWAQSWKLSGAALMPGAFFLLGGIFGYGLGWIDLIGLAGIMALHFIIGWVYLFVSPLFCPRPVAVKKLEANPFAGQEKKIPTLKKNSNPFSGPTEK